jgi:hypothetical protein
LKDLGNYLKKELTTILFYALRIKNEFQKLIYRRLNRKSHEKEKKNQKKNTSPVCPLPTLKAQRSLSTKKCEKKYFSSFRIISEINNLKGGNERRLSKVSRHDFVIPNKTQSFFMDIL